ncbi:DUF6415 family natural product biosynthesis protein [Streptomyces sp. NPDC050263]|uniref:DUF6415 family natural product biosynthesis protein n=1 Tax=Streptomyces sp. NPDC050263 TaxID=3155037 RepID=UPI00341794DE
MNAAIAGDAPQLTKPSMRAAASWFLGQETLPRHQTVKLFGDDFRDFLEDLIPQVEELAASRGKDDVPAMVALAGAHEARRRLSVAERPGLRGEVERVKRLARSVLALRAHYDALTGTWMCLACDGVIETPSDAMPYAQFSPTSGNGCSGHIHRHCADIVRRDAR